MELDNTEDSGEDFVDKIVRLFNLSMFSEVHRRRLKVVCDKLLEDGEIGVSSYIDLVTAIPLLTYSPKEIFETSYLIIRKTPSKGLYLSKCDTHGWAFHVTHPRHDEEIDIVQLLHKDLNKYGKKKNRKRDDSGGVD